MAIMATTKSCYYLCLSFLFSIIVFLTPSSSSSSYGAIAASLAVQNVVKLGAKPDGKTDSTHSFLKAWAAACASPTASTIYVPKGRYLLNRLMFTGQCKNHVTIKIEGTLVAPDYKTLAKTGDKWIAFSNVARVSILGGTLDGRGTALWACKATRRNGCPTGATSLEITNSRGMVINGLRSINSQMFHITINRCENVKMQGVQVLAAGNSPNTDGIHVGRSTGVTITRASIKTGDDCISIGPGTTNLWIEGVDCGPGHGISIGSLGKDENEAGVQNVTVKSVTITGATNGVRIKTWARPSHAFVRRVTFEDIKVNNVKNPIIINQHYCDRKNGVCPSPQSSSGVKISGVTYKNIKGSSATKVAVKFDCSTRNPCTGIVLDNVDLTYENKPATSSCTKAYGSASDHVFPSNCLA